MHLLEEINYFETLKQIGSCTDDVVGKFSIEGMLKRRGCWWFRKNKKRCERHLGGVHQSAGGMKHIANRNDLLVRKEESSRCERHLECELYCVSGRERNETYSIASRNVSLLRKEAIPLFFIQLSSNYLKSSRIENVRRVHIAGYEWYFQFFI